LIRVETVEGASHFLPMERPDLTREAIFEMATA
jgi:pimeloyl-ACP methyl ester carboxylesterase